MAATCELMQLLGRQRLTALQQALGPSMTYIPARPEPDHDIARAIGLDGMEILCREFGSHAIWIGIRYAHAQRNEAIVERALCGDRIEDIAADFDLSPKSVWLISRDDIHREISQMADEGRDAEAIAEYFGLSVRTVWMVAGRELRAGKAAHHQE